MNFKHLAMLTMVVGLLASACCGKTEKNETMQQIDTALTSEEIAAGVFTPEVMYKMGRVGSSSLSPNGSAAVLTISYYSVPENRSETALYLVTPTDGTPRRITDAAGRDTDPEWSGDGRTIFFLSDRSGDSQIWSIGADGTEIRQISDLRGGIESFGVAPTGDKVFYVQKVKVSGRTSADLHPDMPESRALIYDDLMVRHWNYWDRGEYSHIFITELRDGRVQEGRDIMPGEAWDAPMSPYFENSEIAWSNNGQMLAYTSKKMMGRQYALSTDSDIYLYELESGTTRNLTEGMVGYDKYPVFSPDDSRIAFTSMERPGNEADKERVFIVDLATGGKNYLTPDFDYNGHGLVWEDDETLLFIAPMEATHQVCRVGMDGRVEVITSGDHDINAISLADKRLLAEVTRIDMATELFNIDPATGAMEQLTRVNAHVYDNVAMGRVEKRWIPTTDGKRMLTWVIYPPNFNSAEKYPALLYCQGGPQSVVSQAWSFRWNFQLMASQGYIVVAPNRRGLPSFGQEWLDQISGDYSGQNIRDYLSAIDAVSAEPFVDRDRLGCVGASYGGYSSFYLAGVHNKRFKAFIAHCGIFNFESMYGSTEELFFPTNDYGGPYWDKNNRVAQRSYANSPHKLVANWDTPILIIAGMLDYRVPYTQSLEAFTAARVQEIPSRLILFENEAHQVFKPQNAIVWNREFFGWLDKWVKR